MPFVIAKARIGYPPRPQPDVGALPFLTGGIPKVASVLTANTGVWANNVGAFAYQWLLNGSLAYASATNASYSISANNSGAGLTARVFAGNATWGTNFRDAATATVIP